MYFLIYIWVDWYFSFLGLKSSDFEMVNPAGPSRTPQAVSVPKPITPTASLSRMSTGVTSARQSVQSVNGKSKRAAEEAPANVCPHASGGMLVGLSATCMVPDPKLDVTLPSSVSSSDDEQFYDCDDNAK